MTHPSDAELGAVRSGGTLDSRTYDHIDACLPCRRAVTSGGAGMPARPAAARRPSARIIAVAAVALAALLVSIAPVRSLALGFVEIFEPRTVSFVPMTSSDFAEMHDLPDFSQMGDAEQLTQTSTTTADDALQASTLAGFRVREPEMANGAYASTFSINKPGLEQLTFSEEKATRWAAVHNLTLKPMPPGMDGTTIRVAFGSIVTAQYLTGTEHAQTNDRMSPLGRYRGNRLQRYQITTRPAPVNVHRYQFGRSRFTDGIFVAQMQVPKIGSTGVSTRTIEAYLLSQPGVPPKLIAAFSAMRDPSTTLPIPIPIDRAFTQPVFVDGVWGLGIGDETGLGSLVVWERDGIIYGVGGAAKASNVLAIANTLH